MRYALGEFEYDSTFEEIGKVFNVNKERIRQIVAKAIRKLRKPSKAKVIRDGIASYKEATRENEIIAEAAKEKRIAKMQEFKEQVKNGLITNGNEQQIFEYLRDKPLDDSLGLSARAYNCIKRGTCYTNCAQFVTLTDETLLKIRNCGDVTQKEIKGKIQELLDEYYGGVVTRKDFLDLIEKKIIKV
jgi:hypothetical protein